MNKLMGRMDMLLIGASNHIKVVVNEMLSKVAEDEEGANTVEIIIGVAIFAGVAVAVFSVIGGALSSKAGDAANIIESASF